MQGTRAYAASEEVKKGYAKGAAAWLKDDRYNNDYSYKVEEKQHETRNDRIDRLTREAIAD